MIELPKQALPLIERIKAKATPAQKATPAELDIIIEQLLVPLFKQHGVDIQPTKHNEGWTLNIKYQTD